MPCTPTRRTCGPTTLSFANTVSQLLQSPDVSSKKWSSLISTPTPHKQLNIPKLSTVIDTSTQLKELKLNSLIDLDKQQNNTNIDPSENKVPEKLPLVMATPKIHLENKQT